MRVSLIHLPEARGHPRELEALRRLAHPLGFAGLEALEPPPRPLAPSPVLLRDLIVAESDERALELWTDCGLLCGRPWHDSEGAAGTNLFDAGEVLVGSVETVSGQLGALRARAPRALELRAWVYPGRIPQDEIVASLTRFATQLLPAFAAQRAH